MYWLIETLGMFIAWVFSVLLCFGLIVGLEYWINQLFLLGV